MGSVRSKLSNDMFEKVIRYLKVNIWQENERKLIFFENGTWGLSETWQKKFFKNDCVSVLSALKILLKHLFMFSLRVLGSVRPKLSHDMFEKVIRCFKVNIWQENEWWCIFELWIEEKSDANPPKSTFLKKSISPNFEPLHRKI